MVVGARCPKQSRRNLLRELEEDNEADKASQAPDARNLPRELEERNDKEEDVIARARCPRQSSRDLLRRHEDDEAEEVLARPKRQMRDAGSKTMTKRKLNIRNGLGGAWCSNSRMTTKRKT